MSATHIICNLIASDMVIVVACTTFYAMVSDSTKSPPNEHGKRLFGYIGGVAVLLLPVLVIALIWV